ncbi:hypothetical protein ES288_A11G280800v1, partial [Gossypium darwinii]
MKNTSWFCKFPWLEYSLNKDATYYLSCYQFSKDIVCHGMYAFTVNSFNNWKKINDKKSCQDLLNQSRQIDKVTAYESILQLMLFDGNSLELITLLASYNDKVSKFVLHNVPRNAKYTSHMIQKEGEWNNLQALFLNNCPYAYYVHCSAHQLQFLFIIFFSDLNFIFNIISASCKCHDQLQATQAIEIANMLEIDELQSAAIYKKITSFDFVFILHLVKVIMGIIDIFCQHLQQKSQDIWREDGWDNLLEVVKAFCEKHNIEVPDMDSPYVVKHDCHQHVDFNVEHHYRVEIFNAAIDSRLLEINSRFNEQTIDLLTLRPALDPKDAYKSFNMIRKDTNVKDRAFSVMKIVKTRLHNKVEDEFLTYNLVVYIEREIVETFDSDSIFSNFIYLKESHAQFL